MMDPIPISARLGDLNDIFHKILTAAEHPHLNIPETEAERKRNRSHPLKNNFIKFATGIVCNIYTMLSIIVSSFLICYMYIYIYISTSCGVI